MISISFRFLNRLILLGTGEPFRDCMITWGESIDLVGLLSGPNPTANLVSVLERGSETVRHKNTCPQVIERCLVAFWRFQKWLE